MNRKKRKEMRKKLLRKQFGFCPYCGAQIGFIYLLFGYTKRYFPTIDHIIPVSLGGTDEEENLIVCCKKCNEIKDNKIWTTVK